MDVKPNSVPEDHNLIGPTRGQPVCLQVNQTTPPFLQLEARPRSGGHRCLPARLDKVAGICQSTLVPYTPLSIQSQGRVGKDSVSCPSVEDTVVVSSTVGITGGLSKSPSPSTDLVVMPSDQGFLMQQGVPTLITCPISGNPSHHKDFLLRLQASYLPHGDLKPTPTMAPILLNGQIGASKGIGIPLRDL